MLRQIFSALLMLALFTATAKAVNYHQDEILICLKPTSKQLKIQKKGTRIVSNNARLNQLFDLYQAVKVERWLPMADERDVVDGVHLSNIYRVVFARRQPIQRLNKIVEEFKAVEDVQLAAKEAINRIAGNFEPYIPNDPYFDRQWYLKKIKVPEAWGLWKGEVPGDSTVLVGVVDTGIDYTHPDLQGVLYINPGEDIDGDGVITDADRNNVDDDGNGYVDDFTGWDFANEDNDVMPPNAGPQKELSHGTHVAGIIAAVTDNQVGIAGISYRSKLIVTKNAKDDDLTQPNIVKGYSGILYCAKLGAKIINCSWGGGYDLFGKLVIDNVTKNYGAIVVAAAGNDAHNNDNNPQYPSDFPDVIAVASLRNDDRKANYSNFGKIIDISAPGGEGGSYYNAILSTIHVSAGSYASWQGTSMASPVVAGAFALIKAWFPNADRQELIDRLLSAADPIDDVNANYQGLLGAGRVNVYNVIARTMLPNLSVKQIDWLKKDNRPATPGDTLSLALTVANASGWQTAYDVKAVLQSSSPFVTILDSMFVFDSLAQGQQATIDSFIPRVAFSLEAPLKTIEFQLSLSGTGPQGDVVQTERTISVSLSRFQAGFPMTGYGFSSALGVTRLKTGERVIVGITTDNQLAVFNHRGQMMKGFPKDIDATTAAPVIADFDGDGEQEILTGNRRGVVRIFSFDGALEKEFATGEPIYGDIAAGNMDDDPEPEFVFGTMRRKLHVFNYDSTEVNGFPINMDNLINLGPAIGDLNGDGTREIVVGSFGNLLHAITVNGDSLNGFPVPLSTRLIANPVVEMQSDSVFVWAFTLDKHLLKIAQDGSVLLDQLLDAALVDAPVIADLDQDGVQELVFLTDDGNLHILTGKGQPFNNAFPLNLNGAPQTAPLCVDVDNDNQLEILCVTDQGVVHLLRLDGNEVVNFPAELSDGVSAVPVITDLDGDGDTELIVGGKNGLYAIDLTTKLGAATAWSTYQGDNYRSGTYGLNPTAVPGNKVSRMPENFRLSQNYPNPFNSQTVIEFYVPYSYRGSLAKIQIFDILGRKVFEKQLKQLNSGLHTIRWNGKSSSGKTLSSGIYFYRVQLKDQSLTKRMLLIQ